MTQAETYTLKDFSRVEWMERPEYCEYQGIGIDHLKTLHPGEELHECAEHIAFVDAGENMFCITIYDIVTWSPEYKARTATPSFVVIGRTWEGITEVQACPAISPLPSEIIAQMEWVIRFANEKGWHE